MKKNRIILLFLIGILFPFFSNGQSREDLAPTVERLQQNRMTKIKRIGQIIEDFSIAVNQIKAKKEEIKIMEERCAKLEKKLDEKLSDIAYTRALDRSDDCEEQLLVLKKKFTDWNINIFIPLETRFENASRELDRL